MKYDRQMNFAFNIIESTCNLADALMYKHFLFKAVFPRLVKLVQFSYFMHVNPLTYTI